MDDSDDTAVLAVDDWRDLGGEDEALEEVQIEEYDLTSSPNDFNTVTISNFIDSGAVRIPGFQRNYVWDLGRASKLIESLILGLPVPQVFLYEQARNEFLVIDGQQRLMTIYFFAKQRFPRKGKRAALRQLSSGSGAVSDELIYNDEYFDNFNLRLPDISEGRPNRFSRLNYSTLGTYKTQFDLRTIRNVIVKQIHPSDDDSSIYEMFHRLNSGGMNLSPQEIRTSLYWSPLFEMLARVNRLDDWRLLLNDPQMDLRLRDTEILLRAVGMERFGTGYKSSMARFLNAFSQKARSYTEEEVAQVQLDLTWFLGTVASTGSERIFMRSGKFSVTFFEAAYAAASQLHRSRANYQIDLSRLQRLRDDPAFLAFAQQQSNRKTNVLGRLKRAIEILE